MANLARPVSMLAPTVERIIEFKGLNRRTTVAEGEMSDMLNLSSDDYPVLTPRKPRGQMALPEEAVRPIQVMPRYGCIAMIATTSDGHGFFYDGELISEVEGLNESSRMVAINNRICFFPDNTSIDVTNDGLQQGTFRSLEANVTLSAASVSITNSDARLTLATGHNLKYDDAINIHIDSYTPDGGSLTSVDFDISCIVESIEEGLSQDTIILPVNTFIDMTGAGITSFTMSGTLKRNVPDLDLVIEWNNRLWGANSAENVIYACKLGDPSNWEYYQSTSMDSYYAQQGTDGVWTGAAVYSNHLIFFKEDSMCRIYGTSPSNYQITNTEVFGVEKGSRQSVVTINDTVYYKSKIGIMAYSGAVPYCISDGLNVEFRDVVAGTEKRKYYASIHTKAGGYELMVFDTEKGLWHKEDDTRFRSCATIGNRLYFVVYNDDLLTCSEYLPCSEWLLCGNGNTGGSVGIINPQNPTEELDDIKWMAVFGPFDEYLEEHKIYSKLALRLISNAVTDRIITNELDEEIMTEEGDLIKVDRTIQVYISIDEGPWELVEVYDPPKTKGDFIPIIPRRCDRYSIKVEGEGPYEIKTLTRRVRQGSFGRL